MTKSKRFETRITVCVPHELSEKIDAAAEQTRSTLSDFCRRALVEKLERDGWIAPAKPVA